MLDTTIREVNLEKYREIKIQNGKGESSGLLGEEKNKDIEPESRENKKEAWYITQTLA